MTTRSKRFGGNAIEFAYVMPLLVGIFAISMDYAFYLAAYQSSVQSVRAGCRAAAVADIAAGQDPLQLGMDAGNQYLLNIGISASVVCDYHQLGPPIVVECEVDAPFSPVVGMSPGLPSSITRNHRMVVEQTLAGVQTSP